jgi:hypothetical protein
MIDSHITNYDYPIVAPTLSTSTDKYYRKVYTRNSNTPKTDS